MDALAVFIEKQLAPGMQNFSSNAELNSRINVSYYHEPFNLFFCIHPAALSITKIFYGFSDQITVFFAAEET